MHALDFPKQTTRFGNVPTCIPGLSVTEARDHWDLLGANLGPVLLSGTISKTKSESDRTEHTTSAFIFRIHRCVYHIRTSI